MDRCHRTGSVCPSCRMTTPAGASDGQGSLTELPASLGASGRSGPSLRDLTPSLKHSRAALGTWTSVTCLDGAQTFGSVRLLTPRCPPGAGRWETGRAASGTSTTAAGGPGAGGQLMTAAEGVLLRLTLRLSLSGGLDVRPSPPRQLLQHSVWKTAPAWTLGLRVGSASGQGPSGPRSSQ